MTNYVSSFADGSTIDSLLTYVQSIKSNNSMPVGIEWDSSSSSPSLKIIDINRNQISPTPDFFNSHSIWGNIRRCVKNRTTGVISYGSNPRGDGLALDGSTGDVLVEIPTARYFFEVVGSKYRWWIIPNSTAYISYPLHPAAVQRGGSTSRNVIYVGAYEAGLRDDAGTVKLKSITGAQPFTGGEMRQLAFTAGAVQFTVNETLTGASSGATGQVVDFNISSGTWGAGTAAGTVYLKQYNANTFTSENINGSVAGNTCAHATGAASSVALTIDNAETYAKNNGTGFGIVNVHTFSYLELLFLIEYATWDSQSALGQGIVNLASGSGYAGKITGADSIDSRLATNGTGTGSSTNGSTPVCWRGIENLWGNVWEFMIGLNMNLSDGSWKILKADGTGTPAGTLAAGSYDTGVGAVPLADGYISGINSNPEGALAFIPSADVGSSSTYQCDYFYHPANNPSIVFSGGFWNSGLTAGVGYRYANYAPSFSNRVIGARLEFLP